MDENKLLDMIRDSAESVEVPDALQPDQIKKKLEKDEKVFRMKTIYKKWIAAAAAAAVAAISGYAAYTHYSPHAGSTHTAAVDENVQTAEGETEDGMNETVPSPSKASGRDIFTVDASQVFREGMAFGTDSYETVYNVLKSTEEYTLESIEDYKTPLSGFSANGASGDAAAAVAEESTEYAAGSVTSKDASFSTTNIQEAGVDEADIIKTDGEYIYVLRGNAIRIVSAKGAQTDNVASISLQNFADSVQEFYVDTDRLTVIYSSSDASMITEEDYYYRPVSNDYTILETYDISDRSHPVLAGSTKQNGSYGSSRKVGDIVYLFTRYLPDLTDKDTPARYIPSVNDTLLSTEDICVPAQVNEENYLVISSVDTRNPEKTIDQKAILSAGSDYYVSPENIYVYRMDWSYDAERTILMKFGFKDGKISWNNVTALKGYIHDRFCLNEYNGYLRVVMTTYDPSNSLYVLDENMKAVGAIRDIAQGENIQSARFMGNTGYFVTYRNMDPLFSVDLSDPQNPKIIGSLKITGFSSYLHFYGDGLLLGIGEETDPKNGDFYGIKLSMFDISDPSNVTEKDKYVIKDSYDCPALYDPRALMIDPEKNIFGFALDDHYMVFSYDGSKGFVNEYLFSQSLSSTRAGAREDMEYNDPYFNRSCFVGDNLYLAYGGTMFVFDMTDNYQQLASVKLDGQ